MPNGEVGGGHQNSYKSVGTIFQKYPSVPKTQPQPFTFEKSYRTSTSNWKESEAWTAGTPVHWEDHEDVSQAKVVTATICDGIEILATRDPISNKVTEYHPLITFFNKVLADIVVDPDRRKILDGLKTEADACKLWNYLIERYRVPEFSEPIETKK